jgi:hypothetical protein
MKVMEREETDKHTAIKIDWLNEVSVLVVAAIVLAFTVSSAVRV